MKGDFDLLLLHAWKFCLYHDVLRVLINVKGRGPAAHKRLQPVSERGEGRLKETVNFIA